MIAAVSLRLLYLIFLRILGRVLLMGRTSATKDVEYGESVMPLALRGLESKTLDPYLAGWRRRIVPTLGHLAIRMITNGAVDRAVHAWIADEHSRSTVKNSLAVLVRVLDQAVRDGVIDRNVAHITGWQHQVRKAEDELDNPRALALPDWPTLLQLSNALIARSADHYVANARRFAAGLTKL